jgi:hypothetical protein
VLDAGLLLSLKLPTFNSSRRFARDCERQRVYRSAMIQRLLKKVLSILDAPRMKGRLRRAMKTQLRELGCPPIRKKRFGYSG